MCPRKCALLVSTEVETAVYFLFVRRSPTQRSTSRNQVFVALSQTDKALRACAEDDESRMTCLVSGVWRTASKRSERQLRQITIRHAHAHARGAMTHYLSRSASSSSSTTASLVRMARFPWLRRCQSVRQRQLSARWHRVQPTNHPTRSQKTAAVRWRLHELATGDWPMLSSPRDLVQLPLNDLNRSD